MACSHIGGILLNLIKATTETQGYSLFIPQVIATRPKPLPALLSSGAVLSDGI